MYPRVYGGTEAIPHEYPSVVRMLRPQRGSQDCKSRPCGDCGGSILNKEWILTAGHCCTRSHETVPRPVSEMTFLIGAHYDESCEYSNRCSTYVIHKAI